MSDWSPSAVIEWEPVEFVGGRPEWFRQARCRSMDPGTFFPDDGFGVMIAQRICAECPVRTDCLEFALEHNEDHGVWGGESERGRRQIRRHRRVSRAS